MKNSWSKVRLGDVTTWSSGGTPKKDNADFWNGGIPWISANSMHTNRLNKSDLTITELGLKNGSKLAPKNSILLLVRGGALHNRIPVGIALKDVAFNQDVKAIVADERVINPWYLLSWFIANTSTLSDLVEFTGIGAGKLDTSRLQNLIVNLPTLEEQEEILGLAKAIDDKIELNLEMSRMLEKIAQVIFKHWFVDFQFPGFDGEFIDGLPKNWHEVKLDEIVDLIIDNRGKTPIKSGTITDGIPSISAKNVKDKKLVNMDRVGFVDKEIYSKWMSDELQPYDILLTSEAPLGELAILISNTKYCISQRLFAIRSSYRCNPIYLFYYLLSSKGQSNLQKRASGSTVSGIKQSELRKVEIVLPSIEIQNLFGNIVGSMRTKIDENENEIKILTQVRDSLLPKLMSGKIRVGGFDNV